MMGKVVEHPVADRDLAAGTALPYPKEPRHLTVQGVVVHAPQNL